MNNELSDLILIIDSREREQKRINSMRNFFEERGAVVDTGAITIKDGNQITSMDYSIEGSYKGKPVNLGISAKSLVDFSGTIGNLSNELARGYLRFDEVGFILITGCYQTTLSNDGLHAVVRNPAVQDGSADILNTTSMFNALSSWERSGIHCRQILYEEQFPQAVISILNFITKDHHEGLNFCTKAVSNLSEKAKMDFVNAHTHLGIPGVGVKTALKLWDYLVEWNWVPNLNSATSLSEEALIEAIGKKTGKALYEAYYNRYGWIDIKEATEEANRSPPERKLPKPKGNIPEDKKKSFKSLLNQSGSEIITNNKTMPAGEVGEILPLKSLSAKHGSSGRQDYMMVVDYSPVNGVGDLTKKAETQKQPVNLSTPDILKSPEVHCISSADTAEGTILPPPFDLSPPAVASSKKETVKSLEDAIVDRVYDKPETDTVIMREFMSRGFQMPEIHKTIKESPKLHKYKQGGDMMIAYKGVRADKEMDVGV